FACCNSPLRHSRYSNSAVLRIVSEFTGNSRPYAAQVVCSLYELRKERLVARPIARRVLAETGYAEFYDRSQDVVIRVCGHAGNPIETHKHAGEFREPQRCVKQKAAIR
ncbi:MAG TPA: hypothetical protein VKA78_08200, partial [Pyrinomonadaceae bacterium]|nr:hypothetical protein [Pyrinomonadaceae bacterium]